MIPGKQLINELFAGKRAERIGLYESIWGDAVAAWVKQGYPTRFVYKEVGETLFNLEDGQSVDVEVAGEYEEPLPTWIHFGFDMAGIGPWFDWMPLRDCDELVSETEEWDIRRNGAGASLKYWKHKSGTPEHVHFLMTNRHVWERDYRSHLLEWDEKRVEVAELRKAKKEVTDAQKWLHYGHMFIWELMRQSMGDITMYESLLTDPGWIHDYNRIYTDFYKRYFAYIFDQVGLPDGIWLYEDLGYKNGLFASPKVLESLIFPYYCEIIDFFHSYQLPVVLHTCGSTAQALPLIIEAGFDALNPMERKAKDNDPYTFAEKYGDKLVFIGGLDTRIFETNDREIICREVKSYLEGMKRRGARLVFASDHSISTNTRYDSYRYALDVYRENMWY